MAPAIRVCLPWLASMAVACAGGGARRDAGVDPAHCTVVARADLVDPAPSETAAIGRIGAFTAVREARATVVLWTLSPPGPSVELFAARVHDDGRIADRRVVASLGPGAGALRAVVLGDRVLVATIESVREAAPTQSGRPAPAPGAPRARVVAPSTVSRRRIVLRLLGRDLRALGEPRGVATEEDDSDGITLAASPDGRTAVVAWDDATNDRGGALRLAMVWPTTSSAPRPEQPAVRVGAITTVRASEPRAVVLTPSAVVDGTRGFAIAYREEVPMLDGPEDPVETVRSVTNVVWVGWRGELGASVRELLVSSESEAGALGPPSVLALGDGRLVVAVDDLQPREDGDPLRAVVARVVSQEGASGDEQVLSGSAAAGAPVLVRTARGPEVHWRNDEGVVERARVRTAPNRASQAAEPRAVAEPALSGAAPSVAWLDRVVALDEGDDESPDRAGSLTWLHARCPAPP
ncbi:MAG: hypothetical protein IT379_02640 [Deltaproteobacteria bacterium]|nr:hypothetical protein [Deltaproteobacteria bacterium]